MRTPEDIETWLIWNGAYWAYKRYTEKPNGIGYRHALSLGRNAIRKAFNWTGTAEGDGYWWDVNSRYVEWWKAGRNYKEN